MKIAFYCRVDGQGFGFVLPDEADKLREFFAEHSEKKNLRFGGLSVRLVADGVCVFRSAACRRTVAAVRRLSFWMEWWMGCPPFIDGIYPIDNVTLIGYYEYNR